MDRFIRFAFVCVVLGGCSSAPAKDDPILGVREKRDAGSETTTSGGVASDTSDTAPPASSDPTTPVDATPPDAGAPAPSGPICDLGNGLYCGGHHAPGAPNELYRCTDGIPTLEETCAGECARYPDGMNDHCSCWLGNGLYCGGNGVNGDANTLYRCTDGVVTVEETCSAGCEKKPNGFNDVCF